MAEDALRGVMVNELGQLAIVSEFDSHGVSILLALCQTKLTLASDDKENGRVTDWFLLV